MFNKLSTKTLLTIFFVLLVLVLAFVIFEPNQGESNFNSDIIHIDTAKITSISIYPKSTNHKEVKLYKEGRDWYVKLKDNKSASVPRNKIEGYFRELLSIKPQSIAAQNKSKWAEYKVDTSATTVKVFEGNQNTLDLHIGKFTFQRPRTMLSYIRVGNDNNVYQVEGMLSMSFNQNWNYFRDNEILNGSYTDWDTVAYNYPGDSSFVLEKKNKKWLLNGKPADSLEVANFLRQLRYTRGTDFVDDFDQSILMKPLYTVNIIGKGTQKIQAYQNGKQLLIHSNTNPQSYFNGSKNKLSERIFVGKEKFYPKKKSKHIKKETSHIRKETKLKSKEFKHKKK